MNALFGLTSVHRINIICAVGICVGADGLGVSSACAGTDSICSVGMDNTNKDGRLICG